MDLFNKRLKKVSVSAALLSCLTLTHASAAIQGEAAKALFEDGHIPSLNELDRLNLTQCSATTLLPEAQNKLNAAKTYQENLRVRTSQSTGNSLLIVQSLVSENEIPVVVGYTACKAPESPEAPAEKIRLGSFLCNGSEKSCEFTSGQQKTLFPSLASASCMLDTGAMSIECSLTHLIEVTKYNKWGQEILNYVHDNVALGQNKSTEFPPHSFTINPNTGDVSLTLKIHSENKKIIGGSDQYNYEAQISFNFKSGAKTDRSFEFSFGPFGSRTLKVDSIYRILLSYAKDIGLKTQ